MTTRRSSQLAIAYSPAFLRQPDWDVPIPASNLSRAFPASSRNYLDVQETNEEIFDCTGEDLLIEILTGRLARLTVDFDVDPRILAGLMAFAYGTAAAPSGGTNEVHTETVTATGGTRRLRVQIGANVQTTTDLAHDADAGAIQVALNDLSNLSDGDIVVTGTGPFIYTGAGGLAGASFSISAVTSLLTGGTSTFNLTTGAVGPTHQINRLALYALPLLTLYVGFRGSDKQPVVFKNVVTNSIRVRSAARQRVTASVEFIGSADLAPASGFVMPACQDILPVRFGDSLLSLDGTDYTALMRDFEYYYSNDVLTGDHPFTGTGIDATRLERADRRPSSLNLGVLGEPGDPLFALAKAKTVMAMLLRIGPVGNSVICHVPNGALKLDSPQIRFEGEANESNLRLVGQPRKISGNGMTPTNIVAQTSQPTAYLTSA